MEQVQRKTSVCQNFRSYDLTNNNMAVIVCHVHLLYVSFIHLPKVYKSNNSSEQTVGQDSRQHEML